MKPFALIAFILLMLSQSNISAQQNLIYNGDFELYSSCPAGGSSPFSLPYEITKCLGWDAPTYATSDYFNVCNNSIGGGVGIPSNDIGYQNTHSGNAYCGFYAYARSGGGCSGSTFWWEYIQGRFTQPLTAGHIYNIGFYVSLADGSNTAVKQLGFYISNTAVGNNCSPAPLSYNPQITNTGSGYLSDTMNWVLISGNYTALGGEQYITIGNFKDSVTTDTLILSPLQPGDESTSYYYIDRGSSIDITDTNTIAKCSVHQLKAPNIFTPNLDGINDVWKLNDSCFTLTHTFIYNRWGIKVFDTDLPGNYWDGHTTSGEPCSEGVYYYILRYKELGGNERSAEGVLQLTR